jgi:hypothetical protein
MPDRCRVESPRGAPGAGEEGRPRDEGAPPAPRAGRHLLGDGVPLPVVALVAGVPQPPHGGSYQAPSRCFLWKLAVFARGAPTGARPASGAPPRSRGVSARALARRRYVQDSRRVCDETIGACPRCLWSCLCGAGLAPILLACDTSVLGVQASALLPRARWQVGRHLQQLAAQSDAAVDRALRARGPWALVADGASGTDGEQWLNFLAVNSEARLSVVRKKLTGTAQAQVQRKSRSWRGLSASRLPCGDCGAPAARRLRAVRKPLAGLGTGAALRVGRCSCSAASLSKLPCSALRKRCSWT